MSYDFSNCNAPLTSREQEAMRQVSQRVMNGGNGKPYYPDPVAGQYIAQVAKMDIRLRKPNTQVPCFYLEMLLIEGIDEDARVFLEKWPGKGHPKIILKMPLKGTKNDGSCIGMSIGLASRLHENIEVTFTGDFNQLARDIEHLKNSIDETYAYRISYTPGDFYRICIDEILRSTSEENEPLEESEPLTGNEPLGEGSEPEPESEWAIMNEIFSDIDDEVPFD